MRKRLLVSAIAAISFLTFVGLPAGAARPTATPAGSTTVTVVDTCSFRVTYTWSGFSGSGLVAELALGYRGEWGTNTFFAWTFVPGQAGASGSVSATFTLTGTSTSHEYFGFGELFKSSKKSSSELTAVRDSAASSPYLAPVACGSDVAVS
jgi:hypothetical protein